jgi:hypothetical protein
MHTAGVAATVPRVTLARGLAWTLLSFGALAAALVAVLPVAGMLELSHAEELAVYSLVWGGLSCVGITLAARLAFGGWPAVTAWAVLVGAMGLALSASEHVLLYHWMNATIGIYDPEYAWWTGGLFAILVGLAAATFGLLIAPRGAVAWPASAVVIGALLTALIVLSNLPGALDGSIRAESWPLAIAIGASGLYAVGCMALAVMRLRSEGAPGD